MGHEYCNDAGKNDDVHEHGDKCARLQSNKEVMLIKQSNDSDSRLGVEGICCGQHRGVLCIHS